MIDIFFKLIQSFTNNFLYMSKEIEESCNYLLDFTKLSKVTNNCQGVIPAVAQDAESGEVLIVGYVNEIALKAALEKGKAAFWSTSRNELWVKGETSGDFLEICDILVNCEQNSIVYKVRLKGKGSCHTKGADGQTRFGCYYRRLINKDGKLALEFLPKYR